MQHLKEKLATANFQHCYLFTIKQDENISSFFSLAQRLPHTLALTHTSRLLPVPSSRYFLIRRWGKQKTASNLVTLKMTSFTSTWPALNCSSRLSMQQISANTHACAYKDGDTGTLTAWFQLNCLPLTGLQKAFASEAVTANLTCSQSGHCGRRKAETHMNTYAGTDMHYSSLTT